MKIFSSLTKIEIVFLSVILLILFYEIAVRKIENTKDALQEVTVWYFVYNNVEYKADYLNNAADLFCVDGRSYSSPTYRFEKIQLPRSQVQQLRTSTKRCD